MLRKFFTLKWVRYRVLRIVGTVILGIFIIAATVYVSVYATNHLTPYLLILIIPAGVIMVMYLYHFGIDYER